MKRRNYGETHHSAKLNKEQVKELRRLVYEVGICGKCAQKVVLPGVEVHRQTVYDAIHFYTWKHVR